MPNYNEIFMTQFIQTLAQLSAGVVTAVFAVPVYSYYVKGNLFSVTNEYNEEYVYHLFNDIIKEDSYCIKNKIFDYVLFLFRHKIHFFATIDFLPSFSQ